VIKKLWSHTLSHWQPNNTRPWKLQIHIEWHHSNHRHIEFVTATAAHLTSCNRCHNLLHMSWTVHRILCIIQHTAWQQWNSTHTYIMFKLLDSWEENWKVAVLQVNLENIHSTYLS